MPTPHPASARKPFGSARSRRAVAWACSVSLHLIVVAIASRATWLAVETAPPAPRAVVWLGEWRLSEPERQVRAPDPAEVAEPDDDTDVAVEREPDADAPVEREPEAIDATEGAVVETPDPGPAPPTIAPVEERPSRNYIVPDVDWDEERRRAVEQVGEQLALAESYRTFSLDDVIEEPLPEEPGRPTNDIFEAPSGGAGRAFLTPGRSGGPIGRKITALCDVLGGIGIGFGPFVLGSVCAEREPYTYFSHLKPTYMLARPVCTENPGAEAPDVDGPGDPTVKCRLVVGGDENLVPEDVIVETAFEPRP